MNNDYWHETDVFDDDDELTKPDKKAKTKERKRKWREIEAIKEQQPMRRVMADFEQYSY